MNANEVNTTSTAMTIKQMRKRFSDKGFRSEEYSITPLIRFEPAPEGFSVPDGIVVGMVCNGTAKMEVNGREFELRRNNMFLLNEESQIASVKSSKACLGYVITFSRQFLEGIDVDIKDFMGARLIFRVKPCLALSQSDADRLHNVALALSEAVNDSDKIYGDKVIASLFVAFFYTMASVLGRYEMDESQVRKGLRSEELFKQFVEILGEEFECSAVEGIESGATVDVSFGFSAIELTDDPDDGTSWGTIRFILYKGDRYHLTVRTDDGDSIYIDTHDVWEDLDEVGIKIRPEAIKVTAIKKG